MRLKDRLPASGTIPPVYAVITFMAFGWTIVNFLWKFSSWVYFLTMGEILAIFAYSMASALMESLAILGILLLVCLLLPVRWMRDVFITRGTVAAIFGFGFVMFYVYCQAATGYSFVSSLPAWSWTGLALTIMMTMLSTHVRVIARAAAWLSDRLIVFLFLYVPISLVSLIYIIYRNVF